MMKLNLKFTWTNFFILFLLFFYVFVTVKSGGKFGPTDLGLFYWGGLYRPLVTQAGEWFRLVTATLLHANLLHLAFNLMAFYNMGNLLEALIGPWRVFFVYFFSLVFSSTLSFIFIGDRISIGASGAILGLYSFLFVYGFSFRPEIKKRLQRDLAPVLILAMLPFIIQRVDVAAHGGGMLGGALAGFFFYQFPKFKGNFFYPVFVMISLMMVTISLDRIEKQDFEGNQYLLPTFLQLVPEKKFQALFAGIKDDEVSEVVINELLRKYPRDLRLLYFKISILIESNDVEGAKSLFRAIVRDKEMVKVFKSSFLQFLKKDCERVFQGSNDSPCREISI